MKYLLLLATIVSCASGNPNQLSKKAKDLEVYGTKPSCSVVGKVVGVDKMGSKEIAMNHAINQAAELNATGIFVNQEVPNGSKMQVFATAYQCE